MGSLSKEVVMRGLRVVAVVLAFVVFGVAAEVRAKRQTADNAEPLIDEEAADAYTRELCSTKNPMEYFRFNTLDCRKVLQCTEVGLESLVCPPSLAFDLELQACNWRDQVLNCDKTIKPHKAKPLFATKDPLCDAGKLACGDGTCMPKEIFCDGNLDCNDGSDGNLCGANDPNRAPPCDKNECTLPRCHCLADPAETPNNMDPRDIPQMIMITFDDAVNNNNIDLYEEIFNNRQNPNGCDIKATFFVSHKYTNYSAVQKLHERGHEIGVHSMSHNDSANFWSEATPEEWAREMAGARSVIQRFANISDHSVVGVRAPYLRVGGNNQFTMMEEHQFLYDSTMVAPLGEVPLWPYMLYYRMPHECHGHLQKCPSRSFAVWEMVMNEMDRRDSLQHDATLPGCVMVDSCFSYKPNGDQFYNFLVNNFRRHNDTNRAPMGLNFHSAFIKNNAEVKGVLLFWIDEILRENDHVYFVTMTDVLYWMQEPTSVNNIKNFAPWKENCAPAPSPAACGSTEQNCQLTSPELPGQTLRLATCMQCPARYPWLLDPKGDGLNVEV